MQTRFQYFAQKLADRTRSWIGFVLDAEVAWGLFVSGGLPLGVLGFIRLKLEWWASQDAVSQILIGASFLSLLLGLGVTLWNQWGIGLLRWLQGRAFPVVVYPETVGHDELHLSVRSQRKSDTFKASLDRVPVSTADPVPAPLPWRASGDETRKIFAGDREDVKFMRYRFVPPGDYANCPVFLWAIDTASGTTFRGGEHLPVKNDEGFWVGRQKFHVSISGWELGLVEQFTITISPRWHEAEDRAGAQLRASVEPAPQTFFGGFHAIRNYPRRDPITQLPQEFQKIQSISTPVGMMNESDKENFQPKA